MLLSNGESGLRGGQLLLGLGEPGGVLLEPGGSERLLRLEDVFLRQSKTGLPLRSARRFG